MPDALVERGEHQARPAGGRRQAPAGPGRHHQGQGSGPGRQAHEPPVRRARARGPAELTGGGRGRTHARRPTRRAARRILHPAGTSASAKLPASNLRRRRPVADFSLDLNEDQLQIQKWVHDFAEDVIRPAAHEWDEREETPWPIIEEAAKIGLYSMEFVANAVADPTGPHAGRSSARRCAGATPASRCRSSAARSPCPASSPTARPSRSGSGCRSASAPPRRSSSARSA